MMIQKAFPLLRLAAFIMVILACLVCVAHLSSAISSTADIGHKHFVQNIIEHTDITNDRPADSPLNIFIGVLLTAKDYDRRMELRAIYRGHERFNVTILFFIGNDQLNSHILTENAEFSDIIFLPMEENMANGKTPAMFYHVLLHYKDADMVFKSDGDNVVCLEGLYRQLNAMTPIISKSYVYYGKTTTIGICGGRHYKKSHKWKCPPENCYDFKEEHCWIFAQGGFYGVNMNLLLRMKVIFDMVKPPIPKVRRELARLEWKRLRTSKFGEDMKWGYWIKKTQIHYDDNMEITVYPHIIAYEFWEDQPFCHASLTKNF